MNVSSKGGAPLQVEAKAIAPLRYSNSATENKMIEERYERLKLEGIKGRTQLTEDSDLRDLAREYHRIEHGDYQLDTKANEADREKMWDNVMKNLAASTVVVPQNSKPLAGRRKAVRRGKRGKRTKGGVVGKLPPVINPVVSVQHVYRFFVNGAGTNVGITGQMLAGALGGICTVINSSVQCWASTARIHSVKIWTSLSSSVVSSPDINWYGDGVTSEMKDTSRLATVPSGLTVMPPVIVSKPPKNTFCGDWFKLSALGSNPLFSLTVGVGSVIDLDVTYTLPNNFVAYTIGVSIGTVGAVYYLALDGPGANNIRPLGVPTTH